MDRGRIVTLTTDFGDDGFYVGEMRGIILSIYPDAVLVDITHGITPFASLEASLVLRQACRTFPAGTVHLAVVDPGVGTERKIVAVEAHGAFFIAPDNGILSFVRGWPGERARTSWENRRGRRSAWTCRVPVARAGSWRAKCCMRITSGT